MNDQQRGQRPARESDRQGHQPEVLYELPDVSGVRVWEVGPYSKRFSEEMEVRYVLSEAARRQELIWFEEFEYGRAITQIHVEQALNRPLKERKEIYKRWRQDLGDDQARRYAKFTEYVQQNGRPKWFNRELTLYPDTIVLKPSSVSTVLPVSLKW